MAVVHLVAPTSVHTLHPIAPLTLSQSLQVWVSASGYLPSGQLPGAQIPVFLVSAPFLLLAMQVKQFVALSQVAHDE